MISRHCRHLCYEVPGRSTLKIKRCSREYLTASRVPDTDSLACCVAVHVDFEAVTPPACSTIISLSSLSSSLSLLLSATSKMLAEPGSCGVTDRKTISWPAAVMYDQLARCYILATYRRIAFSLSHRHEPHSCGLLVPTALLSRIWDFLLISCTILDYFYSASA